MYLAAIFVVAFAYGAGGSLLFTAGDQKSLTPLSTLAQVAAIVAGVVLGLGFDLLVLFTWKQGGGRAAQRERNRAERTGELPGGVRQEVWLPRLRARRQNLSQLRWLMPFLAGTQVFLAIAHLIRPDGIYPSLFYLADGLLFVVLGTFALAAYPSRIRNLDRLIVELQ